MERWVPVKEYEGFYEISDLGNVRSVDRSVPYGRHTGMIYKGKTLKKFITGKYLSVKLSYKGVIKTKYIHHLVLLSFVGGRPISCERIEIRHLDGDKFNNRLSNLRYGTSKENMADRKLHALGLTAF